MSGTWYPLAADSEFQGNNEVEAAASLLATMTGPEDMHAGTITITGFDHDHKLLTALSIARMPDRSYTLIVARQDGSVDWFTTIPDSDPEVDR
jgi:hypothetical protein